MPSISSRSELPLLTTSTKTIAGVLVRAVVPAHPVVAMASDVQSSTLPPAQPAYVFRGHATHVHSVQFVRQNSRLLTGDADGCIILWNLASKRPVAVWQAHDAAILGFAEWGPDRIIT